VSVISPTLRALADEVLARGTLPDLPTRHFIDGRWQPSSSGARLDIQDPGTGRSFAEVAAADAEDVDHAVVAARRALAGPWRRALPSERGRVLQRTAERLRAQAERLAVVESLDSGKRLAEALGDVLGAARCFEYYAGACDKLHGDTIPLGPDHLAYTVHEPAGVAAQIVPWNYPISTAARGLAPALAAGCTVVLKPAEQTPLSALLLAQLLHEAGLPPGACNVISGTGLAAGAPLASHSGVDHITFTGSVASGQAVMRAAAAHTTRLVLELGGKSPLLVLADADLDAALDSAFGAIFENAGQICSAGSRLLVARDIHEAFVERLTQRAAALPLAHGLRDAGMGPLNSQGQLVRVQGFVQRARARGVALRCGGQRALGPGLDGGWFHQPTILDRLAPDDECVQEEIFGPVLAVQVFDDVEQALALANGTRFALVAGVFTRDFSLAHRLAREIDAGQVYINEYFAGGIELPFGGNRRSGFGREKGLEALRSYCKVKSVAARL
jgi:aldehyde dehydrogenase (NAD+)